jgi:shikimate dehydrogenase
MSQQTDGQPDPLRPEGLEGVERLFGVIGWPVAHSMSPAIHNAAFEAEKLPCHYRLFPVPPSGADLAAFLARCKDSPVPVGGCSVTIPHKQHALAYLRATGGQIEPLAEKIGALNTLVLEPGRAYGCNTDYAAAVEAIASAFQQGRSALAGKRVLLLGAGGAGRAIAFGLLDAGCRVTITDCDPPRAEQLAAEAGAATVPLEQVTGLEADILVNATPVGMHPNVSQSPYPAEHLRPGQVVFDAVYNPIRTRLLTEAEARGCRCVAGVEMFVGQAVAQFERWTGRPAPRRLMHSVVLERLSQ